MTAAKIAGYSKWNLQLENPVAYIRPSSASLPFPDF